MRQRDKGCRYPHCPICRSHKALRLDVAHVVQAKGMSGDRTLERSQARRMMLLDLHTHGLQEQHYIDIRPLTDDGTDGPCEFWRRHKLEDEFFLVARELAPGGPYERD